MDVALKCHCGAVEGVALNITPKNGNRIVCCCDDCQTFADHLNCEADILDEFGGTDIYQTSQSQIRIDKGAEHLRCLRLTSKGLNRWYTGCCNTPVGNTMSAGIPFIGVFHNFLNIDDLGKTLGPVLAYVQTQHARGTPTYPHSAQKFPLGITLRIMRKMLVWKLRGMNKPSAFFGENGKTIVEAKVLS